MLNQFLSPQHLGKIYFQKIWVLRTQNNDISQFFDQESCQIYSVLKVVFLGDQKANNRVHKDSENDKVQTFLTGTVNESLATSNVYGLEKEGIPKT